MKLKEITIQDWFGRVDWTFRWKLGSKVNILSGINGKGKTTLLRDLPDLINPTVVNLGKEPVWKSPITKTSIRVDLIDVYSDEDCYVSWKGQPYAANIYRFEGYDYKKEDFISLWDPEMMLEIFTVDELLEDCIGYFSKLKDEDQQKVLREFNYVTSCAPGKVQKIEELVGTGYRVRLEDNKTIPLENLSFGHKILLSLLMSTPMEKDKVFLIDNPELGLCGEWCRKLVYSLQRLNPECQMIIATGCSDITFGGIGQTTNISTIVSKTTVL